MAFFRVGMRVKVVRLPAPGYTPQKECLGAHLGDTGTVAGTLSHPNHGFYAHGHCDISVLMDRHSQPGMGPSYCFEPILNDGDRACESDFKQSLERLLARTQQEA